jgi:four helix bundle protein
MKIQKVQDFEVWKKADAFSDAVTAILARPPFGRNRKLLEQIETAVDSITSNMSEGFEQPTDRGFANYLFIAKGSTAETFTRLRRASRRGYLNQTELRAVRTLAEEVGRMLTGLIKHLMTTPHRHRGLGLATDPQPATHERKMD